MITIKDFMDLCMDEACEEVSLWNIEDGEEISFDDLTEYEDYEIDSWNTTTNGICFNIDL